MVEQLLLALKIGFVVLLYLFIWRVIRVASRDMEVGQESMILTPTRPAKPVAERAVGRLVVSRSPELAVGSRIPIAHELVAGREPALDITLQADGYASAATAGSFAAGIWTSSRICTPPMAPSSTASA